MARERPSEYFGSMAERMAIARPTTAFISWAHSHGAWPPHRAQQWRQTVLDFATALRRVGGIDADMDLWHTTDHQDWSTYGVSSIRDSDFVLIATSAAYRERWEGTGSPTAGAGAAREANALKGVFDSNREEFLRRVKVVLLPGAEIADIPLELVSSTERVRLDRFDLGGLTPLLRLLLGKPDVPKPPLGQVPALPPTYVAGVSAAGDAGSKGPRILASGSESPGDALRRRISELDAKLGKTSPPEPSAYELDEMRDEREILTAVLAAVKRADVAEARPSDAAGPGPQADEVAEAAAAAHETLAEAQRAMAGLPAIAREALFQHFRARAPLTVGGEADAYGIADAVRHEEMGYINWVEDIEQAITPRAHHPRIGAAIDSLNQVRSTVFGGSSWDSRAHAPPWAQLLLRGEYGIEDPEFELRPVWVELGFLEQ